MWLSNPEIFDASMAAESAVGGQACTLLVAEEAGLPDPEAVVFQVGTTLHVVRTFHRSSLHSLFGGQKGVGSCNC